MLKYIKPYSEASGKNWNYTMPEHQSGKAILDFLIPGSTSCLLRWTDGWMDCGSLNFTSNIGRIQITCCRKFKSDALWLDTG